MRNIASRARLAILAAPLLVTACGGSGGSGADSGQTDAPQTSGIAEGYWPPQPLNATDIEPRPATALGGAQSMVLDSARRTILNNPALIASLGDDYRAFDGALGNAKDGIVATFLFYRYDTDETLSVDMLPDGTVASQRQPAASYQPPEHPQESATAIAMAQSALDDLGFATAELSGTALLDFPKSQNIADPSKQFHSQRILYVTFGPGNGALPVYSALVNLSAGEVSEAGLVK